MTKVDQGLRPAVPAGLATQQAGSRRARVSELHMTVTPPLSDYVVVDLSSGIAGAYCTKLLADGGARGHQGRTAGGRSAARLVGLRCGDPAGGDGALFTFLSSTKQSVVVDPDDRRPRAGARAAGTRPTRWCGRRDPASPSCRRSRRDAIRRATPHLTVTVDHAVRPGRSVERPRRRPSSRCRPGRAGSSVWARRTPDRAPVFVGGQIGEWLTGVYAAIGTMVSRARGAARRRPASSSTCRCSRRSRCASPTTR